MNVSSRQSSAMADADVTGFAREIDRLVYGLYGLKPQTKSSWWRRATRSKTRS
jgi:hypothetical protein